MKAALLWIFVLLSATVVFAQGPCTEKAVKMLGSTAKSNLWSNDLYFFSGALDKPVVGMAAYDAASKPVKASRENESYGDTPQRIVVSASGDMAYEYGTSHVTYNDKPSGKREDFTAAYLRVWKAEGASCKLAAMMVQPEGPK
jgi:ketosteroid isomerase-like protein